MSDSVSYDDDAFLVELRVTCDPTLPITRPEDFRGVAFEREVRSFAVATVTCRRHATTGRVAYWYLEAEDERHMLIQRLGDSDTTPAIAQMSRTVQVGVDVAIKPYQPALPTASE